MARLEWERMAHGGSKIETEVKLRVPEDPAVTRALLDRSGYRVTVPRVFESNTVYDTPAGAFRARGELIRVRRVGERTILTFKAAAQPGRHKRREELETEVGDAGVIEAIVERLGLSARFRYEKYRTEYGRAAAKGTVMLDETPVGVFLELEGSPEWIDATARELGFAESAYILASYGALYLEQCRRHSVEPTHMVFPPGGEFRST